MSMGMQFPNFPNWALTACSSLCVLSVRYMKINQNPAVSDSTSDSVRMFCRVYFCLTLVSIRAFNHICASARAVYLFPPLRSRDWRLQLSSRCSPWQLEMESEHGAEDKPPHTGRKTLRISALRSFFLRWCFFFRTCWTLLFVFQMHVFICCLGQICPIWLRVSKITFTIRCYDYVIKPSGKRLLLLASFFSSFTFLVKEILVYLVI